MNSCTTPHYDGKRRFKKIYYEHLTLHACGSIYNFLRWMNRCWRFVMIKLWNHSLLDARTMDTCNKFLDGLKHPPT